MNKLAIFCIFSLVSVSTFAEGLHMTGSVFVNPNATYMAGTFNVRYNPRQGHENSYVYGQHAVGQSVRFGARDAFRRLNFFCLIPTTSNLYAEAVDISNSLGDGTRIEVNRDSRNNNCTSVKLTKHSARQE